MLKEHKHIKRSKGERLQWTNIVSEKASVVYRFALDSRGLQPSSVSDVRNNIISVQAKQKLLVP